MHRQALQPACLAGEKLEIWRSAKWSLADARRLVFEQVIFYSVRSTTWQCLGGPKMVRLWYPYWIQCFFVSTRGDWVLSGKWYLPKLSLCMWHLPIREQFVSLGLVNYDVASCTKFISQGYHLKLGQVLLEFCVSYGVPRYVSGLNDGEKWTNAYKRKHAPRIVRTKQDRKRKTWPNK